jgi:hypothetical protein
MAVSDGAENDAQGLLRTLAWNGAPGSMKMGYSFAVAL